MTGSLIERNSVTTPSPVTILSRDELLASGRSMIGDILQPQPFQANAINAQANNGGDGATRISLRGLGTDRTLTLLNGRRFVPVGTGADSTVDLNTIPLAVIERVEILKAGATGVYGSDAVGGVVNIITRTDFHGTEASLYVAETSRNDGFTYDASVVTGHRLASGRGSILFSAGMQSQDPVFAGDRAFSAFDKSFDFVARVEGIGGSTATPGGRISTRAIDVNGDGRFDDVNICGLVTDPTRFDFGRPIAVCTSDGMGGFRPFIAPADLFNFQPDNYLYTPSSRHNAYSSGSFQIRPGVASFFEMSFMHRESDQQLASEPFIAAAVISRDSIFNPFGGDIFDYRRRLQEFGPRSSLQSVDTFRSVVGLKGSVPDHVPAVHNWSWELSFNYGRTDATLKNQGNLILSRLQDAIGPSFIDGNGVPRCGTPFAPIAGCVPMNILGPAGSIDQAAVDFVGFTGISTGVSEQQMLLAETHGRLLRLPGRGDVSLAIAADLRQDAGEFTPDALIASGDTTGNSPGSLQGTIRAAEAFAELQIVPVRDAAGVERLELDLSARAVHYDSFGKGVTSKAAALVRPFPGVTLRTTYSTEFRAPSISELFLSANESFPVAEDPCDTAFRAAEVRGPLSPTRDEQCAKQGVPPDAVFGTFQQRVINRGNPEVGAETAKIATAGVVLEPFQGKGLSLSLDYWNIDLAQQIQLPSINVVFNNCYELGIQSACDQVHRDPLQGFAIDFVDIPFDNVGGTRTSGFDAAVAFEHHAGGLGRLRARLEAQRLLNFDFDDGVTVVRGLDVYDLGVFPKLKANFSALAQSVGGAGLGVNVRFVGDFQECDVNDCNSGEPSRDVGSYVKVDAFTSISLQSLGSRETTLTVGVNNVFDRDPPLIYIGFAGDSDSSTYDYLGRFFYARLSQQF